MHRWCSSDFLRLEFLFILFVCLLVFRTCRIDLIFIRSIFFFFFDIRHVFV